MTQFSSRSVLTVFDTLDSTSAEARRRAEAGALKGNDSPKGNGGPQWIVALRQTAGYGRRGRSWTQEAGDFAGSLLFAPDAPRDALGQLSFAAALAVYDALEGLVSNGDMRIKWPNDVLVDGAKISGLLLEMVETGAGPALILGIGINVVTKPADVPYKATRLLDHGLVTPIAPADLARRLDAAFWVHYDRWLAEGFAPLRAAWLERAAGLGAAVTVRLPDETADGVFEDLDDTGGLVLRMNTGTRIINAGDVYFGASRRDG